MKLSDYIPLPELARKSGINYHTLRRKLLGDRRVMIDRVGRSILVRKDERIKKLMAGKQ